MANKKGITISVAPEEIVGSEVMKSGDYKYARIGVKKGDNEYMTISYEWKGDGSIPEFVMSIMDFIKSNKEEIKEDANLFKDLVKRSIDNKKKEEIK